MFSQCDAVDEVAKIQGAVDACRTRREVLECRPPVGPCNPTTGPGCSSAMASVYSPVLLPGYGASTETSQPRGAASVRDSVSVYLLTREEMRQCLGCTVCHHQYLWPWPPLTLHPPPIVPPGSTAAHTHLRLQFLPPGEDLGGLTAWRRPFTVENLLAPQDIWPLHLPSHVPSHMSAHLSTNTPTNGRLYHYNFSFLSHSNSTLVVNIKRGP